MEDFKRNKKRSEIDYLLIVIFLVAEILIAVGRNLELLPVAYVMNITLDIFGTIIILVIEFAIIRDAELKSRDIAFLRMLFIIVAQFLADECAWIFDGMANFIFVVKMTNTVCYFLGPLSAYIFWKYVLEENKKNVFDFKILYSINLVTLAISIIMYAINWIYGIFFVVDSDGLYHRTPLFSLYYIFTIIIMVSVFITLIQLNISYRETLIYISYIIFPIISIAIQINMYGISVTYPALLLSMILIYGNIYLQRNKKIAEQQKMLTEQGLSLMISQIQPHFLYNALTTISNLCRKNPEEAEETTVMFSQYLRMNLDSLKKKEPVPFNAELQHVKMYLEIEKKRFEDILNIEYDIKATQFKIPALSIQPIVENSVKHGICEKGEPGILKISTYADESKEKYFVVIEDDGVGFDTSAPRKEDGRSHVGMINVIDRLKIMVGGDVEIISSPGNGCKTIISIPMVKNN